MAGYSFVLHSLTGTFLWNKNISDLLKHNIIVLAMKVYNDNTTDYIAFIF